MKRAACFLLASVLAASVSLGCNSKTAETPPDAPNTSNTQTATATVQTGTEQSPAAGQTAQQPAQPPRPAVQVAADAAPEQVVTYFLEAIRNGDEATTASLLTTKAREETAKHQMDVAPQSAPGAKYQVAPAQILPDNPDGAHVNSVWTETYPDGTLSYDVVWVLRRQTEGWRIAGMAAELVPNTPMQFLNFEDPADMLKKQEEAAKAAQALMAQQAAEQLRNQQQPGNPQQTTVGQAGTPQEGAAFGTQPAAQQQPTGPAAQIAQPPELGEPTNTLR
jgi:hypothetical protein